METVVLYILMFYERICFALLLHKKHFIQFCIFAKGEIFVYCLKDIGKKSFKTKYPMKSALKFHKANQFILSIIGFALNFISFTKC